MRIPTATYRLQLTPTFGFKDAAKVLPYLAALGITDIYASPIFKARQGSAHGYDVVDPNQLNAELGSPDEFEALIRRAAELGLGWLQDIVPNHMAFDSENTMLMDLLENGEKSRYFDFFDINWNIHDGQIEGRVLIPLLGKFYSEALEAGEIQLGYDERGLSINYFNLRLPLRLESYVRVLEYRLPELEQRMGAGNADFIKYIGDVNFIKTLPTATDDDAGSRRQQVSHGKLMLWTAYHQNAEIKNFINGNIAYFNGRSGDPRSFDPLDQLLSEQYFRLSFWKVAAEELNYRRFFTVNDLISVRVENDRVFSSTHALALKLIKEGKINGLRIDHIDGLHDPTAYLEILRSKIGDLFIVVEKILQPGEELPSFWPVQGTTGYDFMNNLNAIFCDRRNEKYFDRIYEKFLGWRFNYNELAAQKKRLIIGQYMAGDIDNLARSLKAIASRSRWGNDITIYGLRRALVEIIAFFPVYRTYINAVHFRQRDEQYIKTALQNARRASPALQYELNFLGKFMLFENHQSLSDEDKNSALHFIMSCQQYTGPVMAKGFEDTVLYIYNRLISLNEVGGNPAAFGLSTDKFHELSARRMGESPHSLNATSTHDTKRGEDVRARINVLSELPRDWAAALKKWHSLNRKYKTLIENEYFPDENDEYFLYQTLIGAYPFGDAAEDFTARIAAYIIKAVREAKAHTEWIKPDEKYEKSFRSFVEEILKSGSDFLESFLPFQRKIAHYGILNSLSQTLIKITAPGIPDFYQGAELWDLSLVDPDNRRPVDFYIRASFLEEINNKLATDNMSFIEQLVDAPQDGRIKMLLICKALGARAENLELFTNGKYAPLTVSGKFKNNIIAYSRHQNGKWAVVIVPRLLTTVVTEGNYPLGLDIWQKTSVSLPVSVHSWKDAITGQMLQTENSALIGEILFGFPVALLISE